MLGFLFSFPRLLTKYRLFPYTTYSLHWARSGFAYYPVHLCWSLVQPDPESELGAGSASARKPRIRRWICLYCGGMLWLKSHQQLLRTQQLPQSQIDLPKNVWKVFTVFSQQHWEDVLAIKLENWQENNHRDEKAVS